MSVARISRRFIWDEGRYRTPHAQEVGGAAANICGVQVASGMSALISTAATIVPLALAIESPGVLQYLTYSAAIDNPTPTWR